jgi:hypothetical protein
MVIKLKRRDDMIKKTLFGWMDGWMDKLSREKELLYIWSGL